MAFLLERVMPEGITLEFLDAVSEEMGIRQDPSPGLIVYLHFREHGRVRIIEVWESEWDFKRYATERLLPAMERTAERLDIKLDGTQPETKVTEVGPVIRGRQG